MRKPLFAAAALLSGLLPHIFAQSAAAQAVEPSALAAKLPKEIEATKMVKEPFQDGTRLTSFYEGPAGRGTVFIVPLGKPSSPPLEGPSLVAQAALLDAAKEDLIKGTKALGEGYLTGVVQTAPVTIEGLTLACSAIERSSNQAKKDPLLLLNRQCFYETQGNLVGIYVTTPFKEETRKKTQNAQLVFVAATAFQLSTKAK